MRSKIQKTSFWFHTRSSKKHFRSTEGQTFNWPIMTADDSIKCRCVNSGMTGQVGGFQNPGDDLHGKSFTLSFDTIS